MGEARTNAVIKDENGWGMIASPYTVMPRRMWDVKSNRVVAFRNRLANF